MQKIINVILPGPVPSKKNSRNIFVRNGRLLNIPNKKYLDWHKISADQIILQKIPRQQISCKAVEIIFYLKDNRGRDLTNMAESIMDLLVDKHVIVDDNWKHVPRITLTSGGVDKSCPRAVIRILTEK